MKTSSPLVSIVMPAYNAASYLKASIESVLAQEYKNWELLIINDGSTDGTAAIISEYQKIDKRIKGFSNEGNKGLVYTRNRGLEEANGEYIAHLDSDDLAHPERIKVQLQFLEENKDFILLGSACKLIDEIGNPIGIENRTIKNAHLKSLLVFSNYFINSTIMLRASAAQKHTYLEAYNFAEDYHYFTQLIQDGQFANINEVLVSYRIHQGNTSSLKKQQQILAIQQLQKNLVEQIGLSPSEKEVELHYQLVDENGNIDLAELNQIESWLIKLSEANKKSNVFDQESFNHFCAFFYRRACLKLDLGLKGVSLFKQSKLSNYLDESMLSQMKYTLKAILKKR